MCFIILTILLFTIYAVTINAQCERYLNCLDCAGAQTVGYTCRWCLDSGSCVNGLLACSTYTVITQYNCPRNISQIVFPYYLLASRIIPITKAANAVLDLWAKEDVLPILQNMHNDTTIIYSNTVVCDHGMASVIVAAIEPNREAVIAFDSTVGFDEIIAQIFDFLLNRQEKFRFGGRVLKYYNSCFFSLWDNGLNDTMQEYFAPRKNWNITVTGAGIGGSLASMLIPAVATLLRLSNINLLTVGQPRTGDITFAISVESNTHSAFRAVVGADLLADMPKRIGDSLDLAHHFAFEVYFPDGLDDPYHICDQPESPYCSNSVFFKVPWLNMLYFVKLE
ncbi:unnamed protein product, partial [Mesorhabditis spiculigera]